MDTTYGPKSGEGTGLWLAKVVSGLLIIVILIVHFIVNHTMGTQNGLMTYEDVVKYYQNPWIVLMEVAFLAFVVPHALMGLRSVVLDLKPSRGFLRVLDIVFVIAGIGFIVYGTWLALTIASHG
jgi:succinate dehydrogenase / fumarate reductase, membrane anchor subunit